MRVCPVGKTKENRASVARYITILVNFGHIKHTI